MWLYLCVVSFLQSFTDQQWPRQKLPVRQHTFFALLRKSRYEEQTHSQLLLVQSIQCPANSWLEILSTTSWFISMKHQILTNNLKGNIWHEVGRVDKQTSALFLSACSSSSCHASNNTCSYSSHTTTPSILRKKRLTRKFTIYASFQIIKKNFALPRTVIVPKPFTSTSRKAGYSTASY